MCVCVGAVVGEQPLEVPLILTLAHKLPEYKKKAGGDNPFGKKSRVFKSEEEEEEEEEVGEESAEGQGYL